MKIALITPYPPYRGGISKHSENIYTELIKTNDLVVYNFSRLYPKILFPGSNQYLDKINYTKNKSIRSIDSLNPFTWRRTAKDILENKINTIIFRYWNPFFIPAYNSIIKYIKKRNKDIRIYSICDNVMSHEKIYLQLYLIKSFINRLDGIIVMSENVKNLLYSINKNINCKKISLPILNDLNNQIDCVKAKEKLSYNLDKKSFLFFGLIRKYKGLDILLSAINKIDKSLKDKFECIIVGENYEDLEKYKKIINSDIDKNITWNTKYISDEEVDLYFTASDFVVLPYKSASQSGIIPMAYYYTKPVIVSNIDGLTEMIIENKTGYSFKNNNSDDLSNILENCILNGYKGLDINEIKNFSNSLSTTSYVASLLKFINE